MRRLQMVDDFAVISVSVPLRGRDCVSCRTGAAWACMRFRPREGKAAKRRQRRIKRGAFEDMARLAARQGRESSCHDGARDRVKLICLRVGRQCCFRPLAG